MSSRTKKQQASLRRRKNRQKAKRGEHAKAVLQLRRGLEAMKADTNIRMVRTKDQGVALGVRAGLIGRPREIVLQVTSEKIVGGVESTDDLAEVVTQVGLLTLSSLLRFNLAEGPEELAKAFARWAGIDLEALKKEATEESAEAGGGLTEVPVLTETMETVDEDGDIVVRPVTTEGEGDLDLDGNQYAKPMYPSEEPAALPAEAPVL